MTTAPLIYIMGQGRGDASFDIDAEEIPREVFRIDFGYVACLSFKDLNLLVVLVAFSHYISNCFFLSSHQMSLLIIFNPYIKLHPFL